MQSDKIENYADVKFYTKTSIAQALDHQNVTEGSNKMQF